MYKSKLQVLLTLTLYLCSVLGFSPALGAAKFETMQKMVVRCLSDQDVQTGSIRTIYRAGSTQGRLEEALTGSRQRILVIDCPHVWAVDVEAGKAEHMLDQDSDSKLHLPIISSRQKESAALEFGQEVDFFKTRGVKPVEGPLVEGKKTSIYNFVAGPVQFDLMVLESGLPLKLTVNAPRGKRVFEYVEYCTMPYEAEKFQVPPAVTVVEAPKPGFNAARRHYSTSGSATHEPTAPVKEIKTSYDLQIWQTYYYLFPEPALLVSAVKRMEADGTFDSLGGSPPACAFLASIFTQNPDKIAAWVEELKCLTPEHREQILPVALKWSGNEKAIELAGKITGGDNILLRELGSLSLAPDKLDKLEIVSPSHLDMLWGCFMASGDRRYLEKIMSVLPWLRKKDVELSQIIIAGAAEWSLTSNCYQHKKVMQICEEEMQNNPELKEQLTEILRRSRGK